MRRLLAAAVLSLAGAAPAAAGAVAFPAGSTVTSSTTQSASTPALAVAPTGAAVVAFSLLTRGSGRRQGTASAGQVMAALRQPGGGFGTPVALSTPGLTAGSPVAAIDAAGDVTVAWSERPSVSTGVIRAATAPAGKPFGAAVDVSAAGQSDLTPSLAEDAAGDAVIAWTAGRGIIASTRSGASGAWSPEATVALGVTNAIPTQPAVVMNPAGTLALSYSDPPATGSTNSVIYAVRRPVGGAFGTPVPLSPDTERNFARAVTIDPANRITAAYENNNGAGSTNSFSIRANTLAADGTTVGTEQTLTTPGALTLDAPSLASDAAGNVTAVWSRFFVIMGNSGTNHIETATAPAGQPFGALTSLDPTTSADQPSVADDPAGDTVIAWASTALPPATGTTLTIVQRPAGGAFGTAQTLGPALMNSTAVALTAPDNATAAWLTFASGTSTVLASATGSGTAAVVTPTATASPTATPTVTASPTPYALPPVAFTVGLKLAKHQTLKSVRHRKAIKATCTLPSAGTCTARATVKHKRKTTLIAKGKATLTAAGSHTVKLKLTHKGRKALKHRHKPLKVKVRVKASDAAGDHAAATKRLKLKRG